MEELIKKIVVKTVKNWAKDLYIEVNGNIKLDIKSKKLNKVIDTVEIPISGKLDIKEEDK